MNTRDNAKMEIEDFIFPEISFTYTRKSIGQNMEPCGTPQGSIIYHTWHLKFIQTGICPVGKIPSS